MDSQFIKLFASDRELLHQIAQVRAKAALKTLDTTTGIEWTYTHSALVRNGLAALSDLEAISLQNSNDLKALMAPALNIARLWESLADISERTSRATALINSAAAYELAGYQANSLAILRRLDKRWEEEQPDIFDLGLAFLRRQNLLTLRIADRLRTPNLSQEEPDSPTEEQSGSEFDRQTEILLGAITAITGQSLACASRFFLSGDEGQLERATSLLTKCADLLSSASLFAPFNFINTLRSLLPEMAERSTWYALRDQCNQSYLWKRYLKLLARGFGGDVITSTSIAQFWPSQLAAIQQGLLTTSDSKIIKMPTSAGKTRLAELAIVQTLIADPEARCIYVAPFRALAAELEEDFLKILPDLGFSTTAVLGSFDTDECEELIVKEARLLITTPEKLDMIFRTRPEYMQSVKLVVLDEAHLVHDLSRGIKFELLLSRLARKMPDCKFLLLSAVVPDQTLEDFAIWLNGQKTGIISSTWRPAIQRVARLKWSGGKGILQYQKLDSADNLHEFLPGFIKQREYAHTSPDTGRKRRPKFPDTTSKSQVAAEAAFKFSELGPVLVFTIMPRNTEAIASALMRRLEYTRLVGDEILPEYFSTENSYAHSVAREWLGDDNPVTQFLKHGIAIHHGKLPDNVRKAVEADFRAGTYRIIVATSTLAQGVNLPVRTAIMHSCWRVSEDEQPERISARDYWNIAGRAGRAVHETEGTLVHIVMTERDQQDYEAFVGRRNNVEPVESALYQALQAIVSGRISEEGLMNLLDPEVLALAVEEGIDGLSEPLFVEMLSKSLVGVQAKRANLDLSRLGHYFNLVRNNIAENVPDEQTRQVFSTTGLATASCLSLVKFIETNQAGIQALLVSSTDADLEQLSEMFRLAGSGISEMQSTYEFAGDEQLLLKDWISGTSLQGIFSMQQIFCTQSPGEMSRFIEDVYGYRMPWLISAFTRIACHLGGVQAGQLSVVSKFFPSMVKFGVNMPEAVWAILAGVPYRSTALQIARRYRTINPAPSVGSFFEWLSNFTTEQLGQEFGISGRALQQIFTNLSKLASRPLPDDLQSLQFKMPSAIVGIAYSQDRITTLSGLNIGDVVNLERDYDNTFDRNAVIANHRGRELGYIARHQARVIAPEMDAGRRLIAQATEITRDRPYKVDVVVFELEGLMGSE